MNRIIPLAVIITTGLLLQCSTTNGLAAGSSSSSNARVVGCIRTPTGTPAPGSLVRLIPADYNPLLANADAVAPQTDTCDGDGRYLFVASGGETYNLEAVHPSERTRLFVAGIHVPDSNAVTVAAETLGIARTLILPLPDALQSTGGAVYLAGTTTKVPIGAGDSTVTIDSLPSAVYPRICFVTNNPDSALLTYTDIQVTAEDTTIVSSLLSWGHSARILFNTTAAGAGVSSDVTDFPLLVRLTSANFDFNQAQEYGEDIRFTKPDNTPLAFEIERWCIHNRDAWIWVMLDTIRGNDSTQSITMYWGKASASSASSPTSVFATQRGYQGVWHLAEETGDSVTLDATGNRLHGTPTGMNISSDQPGVIGLCRQFDASASFITITASAGGALNFAPNAPHAVYAWVRADSLDSIARPLVSKGSYQYGLNIDSTNTFEYQEYEDATGWQRSIAPTPTTDRKWTLLVAVRSGATQYLYVNGACVDSTSDLRPSAAPRLTGADLIIGDAQFGGRIDEVRVMSMAPSADWIRLCYMNQKSSDALITFR